MSEQTVAKALSEVRAVSGPKAKIAVLEKYKDFELLQQYLKTIYNPFVNLHIRKIPDIEIPQEVIDRGLPESEGGDGSNAIASSIVYLAQTNATYQDVKELVGTIAKLLDAHGTEDDKEFLRISIQRDLLIGATASTINKVWKDLIPTFKVMKAYDATHLSGIKYPALVEMKMDGYRGVIECTKDGVAQIRSSSGAVLQQTGKILDALHDFRSYYSKELYDGFALDGEIIFLDDEGKRLPRETTNGLSGKALRGTLTAEEESRMRFYVFDCLSSPNQLRIGVDSRPLKERTIYTSFFEKCAIIPVDGIIAESEEDVREYFNVMRQDGEEGVVVKNLDSLYVTKKSKDWVKIKIETDCDLEITDARLMKGSDHDIGSLTISTSDGKYKGDIGSGLTETQRAALFKLHERGELLGTIVAVRFHRLTAAGKFYLPRIIEIRTDKFEADSAEKVDELITLG